MTGRYVDGECSGADKARLVRARYDLSQYTTVFAYGDSGEDRELLECADEKFYRWRRISRWADVTATNHPSRGRAHRSDPAVK